MKKIVIVLTILIVGFAVWAGIFYWKNLRRSGPASGPIPTQPAGGQAYGKTGAQNTTGLPLALPPGFSISTFAKGLENPRVLARDGNNHMLVSEPSKGKVIALSDANMDGAADEEIIVVQGLNSPHGLAFKDGKLFIAETNQVAVYDYDATTAQASNKKKLVDLPGKGGHFTRTIGFGPDGRLYIAIGSSCNVCVEKDSMRASIQVANADGSNVKTFASGLRNSVFFAFHPTTGQLWAMDMGRDQIGDDVPPEEMNIITEGKNYGWPYCWGKQVHDANFDRSGAFADFCKTTESPVIEYQAHSAPLGIAFIPKTWPEEYHDDVLVAFHGSWDRTDPVGYNIVRFKLDEKGTYLGAEDFISGWLSGNSSFGRPVDLLFDDGGNLFISDDKAGVVYRVSRAQ